MSPSEYVDFVTRHRLRFSVYDESVFDFEFGKIARRWCYQKIIGERCAVARAAYLGTLNAYRTAMAKSDVVLEKTTEPTSGLVLDTVTRFHLEVESLHLFGNSLVNDCAKAIQIYFGPARRFSLDSFDDLCRNLGRYADSKDLELPIDLILLSSELRSQLSNFGDDQAALNENGLGASMLRNGLSSNLNRAGLMNDSRAQRSQLPDVNALLTATGKFIGTFVAFLESNQTKTVLSLGRDHS